MSLADGKRALTAFADGTGLVWDITPALQPAEALASRTFSETELSAGWKDLAGDDAARAYQAIWTMSQHPETVGFLKARLSNIPLAKAEEVARVTRRIQGAG